MRHHRVTRRNFLTTSALAGAGLLVAPGLHARGGPGGWLGAQAPHRGWGEVEAILARIIPPAFPDRVFPVTDFGAVGDGARDCTAAFRQAIAACAGAGGGRVLVPDGRFLTGAIHLRSRVNLHLSDGATIAFSRRPDQFLPVVFTRWEGVELMNYSALVYAFEQRDIAITGKGTLDGQASDEFWWPWKGSKAVPPEATQMAARARLIEMGARGVPVADRVFGDGSRLRPNFIQPYRCQNVLIEGVTIVNSPMWEIHPVLCRNVTVRDVAINSHGPNNDGCDPESCRDVLIEGCTFDTGDDCIALKSGRNEDGRRLAAPIEDVVIRNCSMKDGHGGVVIGSEVSGGARNIFAEKCRMDSPNLDRALRIKTNSVRGGFVEHVYMRDVTVGQVAEAVVTINLFYEEGDTGKFPPAVREIDVRNVTSGRSQYALLLRGYAHAPIRDIRVTDCAFDNVARDDVIEGVTGLTLNNVRVNGKPRSGVIRRALACAAAALLIAGGLSSAQPASGLAPSDQRPGRADPAFSQPSLAPGLDYTVPSEAEIKAALDRIRDHFVRSTPYRIIDTATNQPISDFSTPVKTAGVDNRNGEFNDWSYSMGVVLAAMLQVTEVTGDSAFQDYTFKHFDFIFTHLPYFKRQAAQFGPQNRGYGRMLDMRELDHGGAIGAALVKANAKQPDPRYKEGIDLTAAHIMTKQLRLPDGTLARPRPMPVALWIDDAYMSIPFLAQMGKTTGEARYFDDAARQVIGMSARLFNRENGLFDHAWFADMDDDARFYWGRGGGWMMMAMAELLSVLPDTHPDRAKVLAIFRRGARGAAETQGSLGLWHQLLDRTDSYLETSASAMFTFAIARGVNRGWLPASYGPVAQSGWRALEQRIRPDGQIEGICVGTTAAYDAAYYYHRPTELNAMQGYGPVLMAGAEVITMLRSFDIRRVNNTFYYDRRKR